MFVTYSLYIGFDREIATVGGLDASRNLFSEALLPF